MAGGWESVMGPSRVEGWDGVMGMRGFGDGCHLTLLVERQRFTNRKTRGQHCDSRRSVATWPGL